MYRLLTIVLMLLSGFSVAGDLTIQISSGSCIGVDEHDRYKYRVGFIVQNTGKKELTIISKSNRISSLDYEVPELVFGHGEMMVDGILIIPPRDELGLVSFILMTVLKYLIFTNLRSLFQKKLLLVIKERGLIMEGMVTGKG